MFAKLRSMPALLVLLTALAVVGRDADPVAADVPSTTLTAPSVSPNPNGVVAHGDGSVSVTSNQCTGSVSDPTSTASSAVTMSSSGGVLNAIPKINGGYQSQPCQNHYVAGVDGTVYTVQVTGYPTYAWRIVAMRDNAVLWTGQFKDPSPSCSNWYAQVHSLTMDESGVLYAKLVWTYLSSSCLGKEAIVALDASNGDINFQTPVPGVSPSRGTHILEIMPYSGGIAVLSGDSVYYYDYDGAPLSSATTFAPSLSSGTNISDIRYVTNTGRVFIATTKYVSGCCTYEYHLYYKNPGDTTISEVNLGGVALQWLYTTPSNGVVATHITGFTYFDSSGTAVYQRNFNSETGASVYNHSIVVDNDGNVILRRVATYQGSTQDQHVIVDSFSPTGTATRLFSSASMGGPGFDAYFSWTQLQQSIGGGCI